MVWVRCMCNRCQSRELQCQQAIVLLWSEPLDQNRLSHIICSFTLTFCSNSIRLQRLVSNLSFSQTSPRACDKSLRFVFPFSEQWQIYFKHRLSFSASLIPWFSFAIACQFMNFSRNQPIVGPHFLSYYQCRLLDAMPGSFIMVSGVYGYLLLQF